MKDLTLKEYYEDCIVRNKNKMKCCSIGEDGQCYARIARIDFKDLYEMFEACLVEKQPKTVIVKMLQQFIDNMEEDKDYGYISYVECPE